LNKLIITDGTSDFSDRSLILPFSTQIKSLYGGASEISSDSKSSIKISLKGTVYDLAPVDIDGYINPYQGNFDLFLNFKGMPMPLISSYMVEFAGYKIEKGKMSLKLNYKVVDKELTASNTLFIDQFELGEKVDNPKAVSLPLEMAIALLKDSDGKITIDIPIKGSLNDPQFSIGSIISEALGNTISNVVRSPFRVLASLFGNDETSISTINFKAGTAVLDKAGQNKLSTLAKLLKERSLLILDVKGTAFLAQDWPAMKEAVLYNSLKKTRAEEINKLDGGTKIQAEFIELSDADYKRLLAEQFIEKFPNLAKKSLFGTPELIDAKTGDFYEVAKKQLSASLKNEQVRLKELASQRSRAIASYLVQKGGVPNEQVFILAPAVDPKRESNEINSILSLKSR
jgi:outer membrane protein OmpA-like peptidoglycan-associated protein